MLTSTFRSMLAHKARLVLTTVSIALGVALLSGTLILTSPVPKVTYRQIIVLGMVLAPKGSEAALGAGLTRVTGGVDYYPYAEGQDVTVSTGQVRAGGEMLANPAGTPDDVLVIAGQLIVTGPVTTVGLQAHRGGRAGHGPA